MLIDLYLAVLNGLQKNQERLVLSGKSGYQNFEQKKPIPENAIYRIYSMTKPITSVMALKLVERGKA